MAAAPESLAVPPSGATAVVPASAAAPAALDPIAEGVAISYAMVSMGVLYIAVNYGLLPYGRALMLLCLIPGTAANILFATQYFLDKLKEKAKAERTHEVRSCRYNISSWVVFLIITLPLSVLACVGLYSAAFAGLQYRFPALSLTAQLTLSTIFFPGLLNEATFIAAGAGKIPEEILGLSRLLISLCGRKNGQVLSSTRGITITDSVSVYRNAYWQSNKVASMLTIAPPKGEAQQKRVQVLLAKLATVKSEAVTQADYHEAHRLLTHPRWFMVAHIVSFILAAGTSAIFCYNGATLIGTEAEKVYNLIKQTGCNPEIQSCEPNLNTPLGLAAFNIANGFNFIFGLIFGWAGAMVMLYGLPVRAVNEPSVKNILSMLMLYALVTLCCGNSVVQAGLSESNKMNATVKTVLKLTSAANASFANAAPIAVTMCDILAGLSINLIVSTYTRAMRPAGAYLYETGTTMFSHARAVDDSYRSLDDRAAP